jgi:hypothetical protein
VTTQQPLRGLSFFFYRVDGTARASQVLLGVGSCAVVEASLSGERGAIAMRQWSMPLVGALLLVLFGGTACMSWLLPRKTDGFVNSVQTVKGDSPANEQLQLLGRGRAADVEVCSALKMPNYGLCWMVMTTVCGGNAATMNILAVIVHDRNAGDPPAPIIFSMVPAAPHSFVAHATPTCLPPPRAAACRCGYWLRFAHHPIEIGLLVSS